MKTAPPEEQSNFCLAFIESAPWPMATVEGASHIVRSVNPAFCHMMKKSVEELVGKPFCDLLPEKDGCKKLLDRVFRTGEFVSHTEPEHSETQALFWSYTAWPVLADQGVTGAMIQVTETAEFHQNAVAINEALTLASLREHERAAALETARQKTAQELAEKARLLDLTHDAIIVRGLDDKISLWNKGAENLYGWTSEEAIGKHLHNLMQTEFPKPMEEILAQLHREGQYCDEVIQIARDGRRVTSLCRWVLDPETQSILTSYTDITGSKLAEKSLHESEERFRTLFDSAPVAVFVCDRDAVIQHYNRRAVELWGREPVCGVEQHCGSVELWLPGGTPLTHAQSPIIEVMRTGIPALNVEVFIERPDGSRLPVLVNFAALKNEKGEITGAMTSFIDITERKRAEEKLERTVAERTAELRETNEQLEAFVYSVAHDLRNPLRTMQGFAQVLMEDHAAALDDTASNYLTRIHRSAEFMDKLILDLLAFGRTARAEIEFEPVDVQIAWGNAVFQCATEIEKTKTQIEAIPPFPIVRAHETTLSQALANLLGNAIKFVPRGVLPHIRFWTEENGGAVRLWIQDNGVGIPQEHQERVFRVFERLQGARYPGTGIGLSIVRKGVERMNGKIGLESEPGQGSRFWIELPKG